MITRKTEKILLFINERFKEQIKHNEQLEDKEIVMYAIKSDFDFLNMDILRDEIAEYKRNGEINYLQNDLLRIAKENFELYNNHLKNEPFDFPVTHSEDYLITTKGNLTWDQWKLSDNKKLFPIEPEYIYNYYHNRQFVSYCEDVIDWINKDIFGTITDKENESEKIKWNCSPAIFGFLFSELVKQNYIKPPLYNGETNMTGLAKLLWNYFEIKTTKENFIKEMNPNKTSLSETKRMKFTIPDLKSLD